MTNKLRLVATDLDGTLLDDSRIVSAENLNTLRLLEQQKILRVVATGRSPYSFRELIPDDFPIDYLVFSSGAGIMEWKSKRIIYSSEFSFDQSLDISLRLKKLELSFKLFAPIPENHTYHYWLGPHVPSDFKKRMDIYTGCEKQIQWQPANFGASSQFLVILDRGHDAFDEIASYFPDYKVIKATSPMDHQSLWMEIFAKGVSKGAAIKHLIEDLGISRDQTMSIGNDYNDIDMLDFTAVSYMVSNAPSSLKAKYQVCHSNGESGFSKAVHKEL